MSTSHTIDSSPRSVRTSVYMQNERVPRNRWRKARRTPSFGWTERQAGYECVCVCGNPGSRSELMQPLMSRSCMIHARVTRDPTTSRFEKLQTCHTQQRHSVDSREQQGGTSIDRMSTSGSQSGLHATDCRAGVAHHCRQHIFGTQAREMHRGKRHLHKKGSRTSSRCTSANRREFWPWHMFQCCLPARLTVGMTSCLSHTRAHLLQWRLSSQAQVTVGAGERNG